MMLMDDTSLALSVTGMTCAACVASVERVLSGVAGVKNVSVNLPLEKAIITLDAAASCLLYTSPSPRDISGSRMPSSA